MGVAAWGSVLGRRRGLQKCLKKAMKNLDCLTILMENLLPYFQKS